MRCGRVGILSPLQFIVPGSLQSRAGLKTVRSTFTCSEEASAIFSSTLFTSPSSSAGRLMRYVICAPLPESSITGSGQPSSERKERISFAFSRASWCSSSVLDMPDLRTASQSMSSHLLLTISLSAVAVSERFSRLYDRARRSGVTGLIMT